MMTLKSVKLYIRIIGLATVAALAIFFLAVSGDAAGHHNIDYVNIAGEYQPMSIKELHEVARNMILRQQPDSALAVYAVVNSRFSESLPDAELALFPMVFNNIGYIYCFFRLDYVSAMSYFDKGLALCERGYAPDSRCCLYLNTANIYTSIGDYPAAVAYLSKALHDADSRSEQDDIVFITTSNLIHYGMMGETPPDSISTWLKIYDRHAGADVELKRYTAHMVAGYRHFSAGDYTSAIGEFKLAERNIDTSLHRTGYVADAMTMQAETLLKAGEPALALKLIEDGMALLDTDEGRDERMDLLTIKADCRLALGDSIGAERDMAEYYKRNSERFGYRLGLAMQDVADRRIMEQTNTQMREMSRQRGQAFLIGGILVAALIMISILLFRLYTKSRREHQLLRNLYDKAVSSSQPEKSVSVHEHPDRYAEIFNAAMQALKSSPKVYDPGFALTDLAELCHVHPRTLSVVINSVGGKNFATFLAEQRVAEACRRIADRDTWGNITLEALAESVGFQSRTNFSRVFKNVTGLTPSEFVKISLSQSRK